MLNGLDLFSGIGGLTLALMPYVRPLCYCEHDKYCQSVLLSRMSSAEIPLGPIWDDVRTLSPVNLDVPIDIVYGGFPCQDISCAGARKGLEGDRSRLFFELLRLVSDLRPRFVFLENVPAISVRGLERVLLEFTALGYDSRWTIVSAAEVGACHQRDRWFLLAHSNGQRGRDEQVSQPKRHDKATAIDASEDLAYTGGVRLPRRWGREPTLPRPAEYGRWITEPTVRGRNHGVSHRVDRIRGLGNAVVPAQARVAFERLSGMNVCFP